MSYTLIQQFDAEHVHLHFNGTFQGKNVTWDTHFFTLDKYAAEKNLTSKTIKQVIQIEPGQKNTLKLTVALNIPVVNEPHIQKMMIMIKQYKNLSLGIHQYG